MKQTTIKPKARQITEAHIKQLKSIASDTTNPECAGAAFLLGLIKNSTDDPPQPKPAKLRSVKP